MISAKEHRELHKDCCSAIVDSISSSTEEQVFFLSTYQDEPDEIYMAKFPLDYINASAFEEGKEDVVIDIDAWEGLVEEIIENRALNFAAIGLIIDGAVVRNEIEYREIDDLLVTASTSIAIDAIVQSVELEVGDNSCRTVGQWFATSCNPNIVYELLQIVRLRVVNQG